MVFPSAKYQLFGATAYW
uniref:Uncharacterized protein n=1 Tax=Arundo donax TaxID=35708 RepID=A0A0A8YV09_ARUDO